MGMNHQQRMRSLEDLERVSFALAHIGSAEVQRPFSIGSRNVRRGEVLTRDELLQIPSANLRALASNHFLNLTLDSASYRRDHNEKGATTNAVRPRLRKSRRNLQKR
jgi:hypothetical protein